MRKVLVLAAFALLGVTALAMRPGGDTPLVHAAPSAIFTTLVPNQVYSIPLGTTRVLVEARGGSGQNFGCVSAGFGSPVTTILDVTGLTQLFVNVGGNATGNIGGVNGGGNGGVGPGGATSGGGGGGASDVRTTAAIASRVVVAGVAVAAVAAVTPALLAPALAAKAATLSSTPATAAMEAWAATTQAVT